jgi:hypothetical protein
MRARLPLATPVPFVLLVLLVVGYAPSAGARRRDPMFKEYAPVCEVSLRGISHAERAAALKASQEPPPAPAPKRAADPVFPSTLLGYRVERQFDPPYRVEALWSTSSGTLRVPELSPRGARAFVEKLGVVLGFSPMPAMKLVSHYRLPAGPGDGMPPTRTFVFDQVFAAGEMSDGPGLTVTVHERTQVVIGLASSLITETPAYRHKPIYQASDAERALVELRPNLVIGFASPAFKTQLRTFVQSDGTPSVVWAVPARHTSCEPGPDVVPRHPYLAAIDANNLALLGYFDWNTFGAGIAAHGAASCFDPVVEHLPLQ